jgi:hypothetical protein
MNDYLVLYRDEKFMSPVDAPFGFACQADDAEQAEGQCLNAYNDVDIVWVHQGRNMDVALSDYWNTEADAC